jgi:hypothetical protein
VRIPVTENDFLMAIREAAQVGGWACFHPWISIRSTPGFPDLVLVHPQRGIAFVELKGPRGRLRLSQVNWLNLLKSAAALNNAVWVCLWAPGDLDEAVAWLVGQRSAPPGQWEILRLGGMLWR